MAARRRTIKKSILEQTHEMQDAHPTNRELVRHARTCGPDAVGYVLKHRLDQCMAQVEMARYSLYPINVIRQVAKLDRPCPKRFRSLLQASKNVIYS